MNRRGSSATAVALLVAVAMGCEGGAAEPPPEPTVPTAVSTSSSTAAPVDVSVIPAVIDEPYLNRVLAALDEVEQRAAEVIITNRSLVPEAVEILNSIYSDDEFTLQVDQWLTTLVDHPERLDLGPEGASRATSVERVIAESPSCVWLAVTRRYPQVASRAAFSRVEYVALQPLDRSNDPKGSNPTAWMIIAAGFRDDGEEPSNPCPA